MARGGGGWKVGSEVVGGIALRALPYSQYCTLVASNSLATSTGTGRHGRLLVSLSIYLEMVDRLEAG